MKLFKKTKKGFTLVELVVVIAVIAILSAVSVGAYFGITDSANNSRLEQETKQLHTNIQAISLGTSSNQSLGKDGLTVTDIDQLELDLEANAGEDFEVLTSTPLLLSRPTVVLSTSEYSKAPGAPTVYHTFEYYNPEISNKKVISDVVTGDMDIENIPAIPVNKDAEDVTNTLVYLANEADWENVYIYAWDDNDNENATWPGLKMTNNGDNLWSWHLTSTFKYVVFNAGVDLPQTDDLVIPVDTNNCYYNVQEVWGEKPSEDITVTPAVTQEVYFYTSMTEPKVRAWGEEGAVELTMEAVVETPNLFKADLDVRYTEGLMFRDHTANIKTNDLTFDGYNVAEDKVVWDGTQWITKESLAALTENTVYVIAPETANEVKIWYWGGVYQGDSWDAGILMDKESVDGYNVFSYDFAFSLVNFKVVIDGTESNNFVFDWTETYKYFDYATEKWITEPGSDDFLVKDFVAPESISLVGTMNGWDPSAPGSEYELVASNNGKTWTGTFEFEANAAFKLVGNHNWGGDFETGAGNLLEGYNSDFIGGDNDILVKVAGEYSLSYDALNKKLSFTSYPNVCFHDWSNNNGICKDCSTPHDHSGCWLEGVCSVCHLICSHDWSDLNGICKICTKNCSHEYVGGTCTHCGAAEPTIPEEKNLLYLVPNSKWMEADARFAAYFFEGEEKKIWVDMTDADNDNVYEVEAPTGYSSVIFCRMNPANLENDWGNKWNQTSDLLVSDFEDNRYYHVLGWDKLGFYGGLEDTFTKENYTIYFHNVDNWATPYIWAWNDSDNFTGGTWPGTALTEVEGVDNLYKLTFTEAQFNNIKFVIFSNNNGTQTGNLSFTTENVFYYSGSFHSSL